jgi:hypothetical protein
MVSGRRPAGLLGCNPLLVPFGLIGLLLAPPQTALAQVAVPLGQLAPAAGRDDFRDRFETLLCKARGDAPQGWRLARDLGHVMTPLLWELQEHEREPVRRFNVLIAALLAGGILDDERLFAALKKSALEDKIVLLMHLACGPMRRDPRPDFWSLVQAGVGNPPPVLLVAAYLAAARIPGAAAGGPSLPERDPALAAALAAHANLPEAVIGPWFESPPRLHADLVMRGYFLGSLTADAEALQADPLLGKRAQRVFEDEAQPKEARICAALVLARTNALLKIDRRPDWDILQVLASTRRAAQSLQPFLKATPGPLDAEPGRLAVEYVLGRSTAAVLAEHKEWSAVPAVSQHIVLALAWRLCNENEPVLPPGIGPVSQPEWFFVQWACGKAEPRTTKLTDPVLEHAAVLAAEGRLPRATASTVLEAALWRLGSHPGLCRREAELRLLRDLLITGSDRGRKYQPSEPIEKRYLPKGLATSNPMFDTAISYWDFLSVPEPPVPDELRLR